MQLQFFGAAGEVTGSCHIVECNGNRILLDCGMIQGGRRNEARNRDPFPFDPKSVDAVVLSHAHIDHSGRLPLLVKRGFDGPIHAHNATCDLAEILLEDAARLAASSARNENRRRERKNRNRDRDEREGPVEPLYELEDAQQALACFKGHRYREPVTVVPGIQLEFQDAGHIMGSCVVRLTLSEGSVTRRLVFSGDLGQSNTPILNDPVMQDDADIVLMESTYGNRNHRNREDTVEELGGIIADATREGGVLLIPAFAVGRSQEILYHLGKNFDRWGLLHWKVFLDSPLAIKTSRIYWDYPHLYDDEATSLRRDTKPMPMLKNLHMSRTREHSMAINHIKDRAIVIAGSGMLNGGRILHHLKQRLDRPETRVLFTGYQPPGSLGSRLIERPDRVRIHGEQINVAASMHTLGGLSAHGDQEDLLSWYKSFKSRPPLYLVHGNPDASEAFAARVRSEAGGRAFLTQPGESVDLAAL